MKKIYEWLKTWFPFLCLGISMVQMWEHNFSSGLGWFVAFIYSAISQSEDETKVRE